MKKKAEEIAEKRNAQNQQIKSENINTAVNAMESKLAAAAAMQTGAKVTKSETGGLNLTGDKSFNDLCNMSLCSRNAIANVMMAYTQQPNTTHFTNFKPIG